MVKRRIFTIFLTALGVFYIHHAAIAGVNVIQDLSFGEFLLRNNDVQHTITINTNGTYNHSAGFVELSSSPEEGIYDITGLPANTAISSIDVTQTQALTGATNSFDMDSFQTSFTGTDGSGVARVILGATLETTGNGSSYTNQTYYGELELQINF